VDVVTFGQYLRPTKRHMKGLVEFFDIICHSFLYFLHEIVSRFVDPAEFDEVLLVFFSFFSFYL